MGDSIDITGGAGRAAASRVEPQAAQRIEDEMAIQLKSLFAHFLNEFTLPDYTLSTEGRLARPPGSSGEKQKTYAVRARMMKEVSQTTLLVDYDHMVIYQAALAEAIRENFHRLLPHLTDVVCAFMRDQCPDHPGHKTKDGPGFRPGFYNLGKHMDTIRDLKTKRLGELMCISGTVTRTSAVRPELAIGAFRCNDCKTLNSNVIQQFKYTEPSHCRNPVCENRQRWFLDTSNSVFQDWQLVRIQENSSEIPAGSMPRSMKIVLRHEECEKAKPGDKCTFTGTLIVVPDIGQMSSSSGAGAKFAKAGSQARRGGGGGDSMGTGVTGTKELGVRDLTYSLCFLASTVQTSVTQQGELVLDAQGNLLADQERFTEAELDKIHAWRKQGRLYTRMVSSIAPNIFGHDEIKRGVLLMLLGGVHKKTSDGQNLRGDINVCIVGDPSTSKSQFLKYVCTFLPRAVYTSGKASSAAGLTASIARDPETGEFAIEAGALMLADNGICCIDEFDKMDPADQVAIHEAMEQQTISIAKAGIQATLNARTSILAAANPIKGRYDPSRTLKQNVDISAPIMSRFDLFFVVLDEGDQAIDYNIARHIVNVHSGKATASRPEFSLEDLQLYVRYARTKKPSISAAARKDFVENYCQLRGADATGSSKSAYRITVRQLESMIRLAEARARLDLQDVVTPDHVKEAARLLKKSIVHVENRDVDLEEEDETEFDAAVDANGNGHAGDDDQDGNDGPEGGNDNASQRSNGSKKKRVQESKEDMGAESMEVDEAAGTQPGAQSGGSKAGSVAGPKTMTLSFNDYQRYTLLLVRYLRARETEATPTMSWSDLVNGYISEYCTKDVPKTEAELVQITKTLELVIHRLIKVDHILLLLKKSKDKHKRMLKVHPNFTGENGVDDSHIQPDEEEDVDESAVAQTERDLRAVSDKLKEAEEQERDAADGAMEVDEEKAPSTPVQHPKRTGSKGAKVTPAKTPSSGRSKGSRN